MLVWLKAVTKFAVLVEEEDYIVLTSTPFQRYVATVLSSSNGNRTMTFTLSMMASTKGGLC
jgi:hypothetical protein